MSWRKIGMQYSMFVFVMMTMTMMMMTMMMMTMMTMMMMTMTTMCSIFESISCEFPADANSDIIIIIQVIIIISDNIQQ